MNIVKKEAEAPRADIFKWALVWLLLAAGIAANYYFAALAAPLRLAAWLVLLCLLLLIAVTTAKGQQTLGFLKASRMELRKVVWPTRRETVQMTLLVVAVVVVMALVLWGVDTFLFWLVGLITG